MKRKASAVNRHTAATLRSILFFAACCACPVLVAGTDAPPSTGVDSAAKQALDEIHRPFGEDDQAAEADAEGRDEIPEEDFCDWHLEDEPVQEQSRELVRGMSCHTFRWFDSWWGDRHDFDERAVNGLMTVGLRYTEFYGVDTRFRLRVRAPLPNLSSRWDLILGRVDEEAFVTDTQAQDGTFYNPGVVERGDEESWLLGLGHRGKARKSGWDYSVGVRLRVPPEPYVKTSWYYNKDLSERSDFRFRQTFFWRSDRSFGTTSRGDLAYAFNNKDVLRWEAFGTTHDETQGVQWYAGQTWYHLLAERSAFSLRTFVRGETGADVGLKEYGIDVIWRRPFTRDWLYLSVGPTVTWPREELEDRREASLGFNLWLEMEFGRWRY